MFPFHSYRSKLQTAFVVLGVAAITVTGWQASEGAASALRQATFDRLTAIGETKRRQIERYFETAGNHVLALSNDQSVIRAMEAFGEAWRTLPAPPPEAASALRHHYDSLFGGAATAVNWYASDPGTVALQWFFIFSNPYPGARETLVSADGIGRYSQAHAQYHPTFARYRSAFGFYDILFIEAEQGRVVYSVVKEIDLGSRFRRMPFSGTNLARAFTRAMSLPKPELFIIEDYAPYPPSNFAPAAFLVAPVWRAGVKIGVIAIQVSIEEVNRMMTSNRKWRDEGLGETGQAYIAGPDGALRSDVRIKIEQPAEYLRQLAGAGVPREIIERVGRNQTVILNLPLSPDAASSVRESARGLGTGLDFRGAPVLRAHSRLDVPGLDWVLVAEIEAQEAFAPIGGLRLRILGFGLLTAVLFLLAASYLARSVTRPVLALAEGARRLGGRDFQARLSVTSKDEVGQLAESFNRMAEELERTTVSRDELIAAEKQLRAKQRELEALTARLFTAHEEERSRLARELHDDLTQRLAAVAIDAGRIARDSAVTDEQWHAVMERIRHQLARISDDVHGLSRRLHPAMLDDIGIEAAIESECRSFFEQGGAPVEFVAEGSFGQLRKDTKTALYRIVQEALRNIRRHAQADHVSIRLERNGSDVELQIRDNGCGFDCAQPGLRRGLGLFSMQERARLIGGRFMLDSRPGEGTKMDISLPSGDADGQA